MNYLIIFYAIELGLMPVCISILSNLLSGYSILNEEIKKKMAFFLKILLAFIVIFFFKFAYDKGGLEDVGRIFYLAFYYTFLIIIIISVNYFSSRNLKIRMLIDIFIDEIEKFFKQKFLLNIVFMSLSVFLFKYKSLYIGLVGAYIFYFLTAVSQNYKKELDTEKMKIEVSFSQKLIIFILNICLVYSFASIERILMPIIFNGPKTFINPSDLKYLMIFMLFIGINIFYSKLEKIFKFVRCKIKQI